MEAAPRKPKEDTVTLERSVQTPDVQEQRPENIFKSAKVVSWGQQMEQSKSKEEEWRYVPGKAQEEQEDFFFKPTEAGEKLRKQIKDHQLQELQKNRLKKQNLKKNPSAGMKAFMKTADKTADKTPAKQQWDEGERSFEVQPSSEGKEKEKGDCPICGRLDNLLV